MLSLRGLSVTLVLCAVTGAVFSAEASRDVRCVKSRGDVLRHSDIVIMYQENNVETLWRYGVDVVAWGSQLPGANPKSIAARCNLIARAHEAGVRLHAVDCALAQEGARCLLTGGKFGTPSHIPYWQLRKDNAGALKRIEELGLDLKRDAVLDLDGKLVGVPWLQRWRDWLIPMTSVYSPTARRWFLKQMDALAATNPTALHFDEPCAGAFGVVAKDPGDFSDHAMAAFREWLRKRPARVWQEAGVTSLDDFNYRDFVRTHGGVPKKAPLWREFVRFQLLTAKDFARELRDHVRAKVGRDVPLSMNTNLGNWVFLPFVDLQDFAMTEVWHGARERQVPKAPLLIYKLGDGFRLAVVTTATGHDWYEMETDQHPVLVCTWLAMGYALGHNPTMPCNAWVNDPEKGSGTYRPTSDHYVCFARFVKAMAYLLNGYEAVSTVGVVVGCDAIQGDRNGLSWLVTQLADQQIPFNVAVEGNDLVDYRVSAADLAGCSAVLVASSKFVSEEATARVKQLAGSRFVPYDGKRLPEALPRPIRVKPNTPIWVLPRRVPDNASAPIVLHLLNRDYDAKQRDMVTKGPFKIILDRGLFGGRTFQQAVLHQTRLAERFSTGQNVAETMPAALKQTNRGIELTIPRLYLWGVVELK